MQKKEYLRPELSLVLLKLENILQSSPEILSGHVDSSNPGWNEPVLPDPEDDIEW